MTSTSFASFSDNVPEALSCGGGASMAAIFFLFFVEKKLPKNPSLLSVAGSKEGLEARGGTAGGSGRPVLGSTCVGLAALARSLTIAIACGTESALHRWLNGIYTCLNELKGCLGEGERSIRVLGGFLWKIVS